MLTPLCANKYPLAGRPHEKPDLYFRHQRGGSPSHGRGHWRSCRQYIRGTVMDLTEAGTVRCAMLSATAGLKTVAQLPRVKKGGELWRRSGGPSHRMPKHSPLKSGNTMAGRRGVLSHGLFRAALDFDLRTLRRPQTQRDTTNSSMATDEPLNTMRLRIIGSDILRRSSMLFQLPTNW
jgi:hypothetical protein